MIRRRTNDEATSAREGTPMQRIHRMAIVAVLFLVSPEVCFAGEPPAGDPQARNVWAPEIFYDGTQKQFMIFWASTIPGRFPATDRTGDGGYNHRMYFTVTTDFDRLAPAKE